MLWMLDKLPKTYEILLFLWSDLQHIEQDERVSMGLNGDLYFSHAVEKDSRRDYCCFAAFPRIRTIVQKTAMSVVVKTSRCHFSSVVFAQVLFSSQTSMMQTVICFQSPDHLQHVHWCPYSQLHFKRHPSVMLSCLCASPWFYVVILILVMFVMMYPCCPHVHCFFLSHPPSPQKKVTRILTLVSFTFLESNTLVLCVTYKHQCVQKCIRCKSEEVWFHCTNYLLCFLSQCNPWEKTFSSDALWWRISNTAGQRGGLEIGMYCWGIVSNYFFLITWVLCTF